MNHSRRRFLETAGTGIATLGGVGLLSGSASAAQYSVYTDLRSYNDGVTAAEIDDAIYAVAGDCPLVGLGDAWKDVAAQEGMDAVYMAGHAPTSRRGARAISRTTRTTSTAGARTTATRTTARRRSTRSSTASST